MVTKRLDNTAEALDEVAFAIGNACSTTRRVLAGAFASAHHAVESLREHRPELRPIDVAASLEAVAERLRGDHDPGWAAWTLWSIKIELCGLASDDPHASLVLPEADRLMMLILTWTERLRVQH